MIGNHALAAYYHGRIAQNAGDNEHAASLFLEAKDCSEKNGDFITVGLSSNKLGDLYYNAVVFDKSLECYSASRSGFYLCSQIRILPIMKRNDGIYYASAEAIMLRQRRNMRVALTLLC